MSHRDRGPPTEGWSGRGDRPGRHAQKNVIEDAYALGERLGLLVLCQDEAGPYQAIPQPGPSWQPCGQPAQFPHEYVRGGTVKLLTLFRPATGEVWAEPVEHTPNTVLHPWLQAQLTSILDALPAPAALDAEATRAAWAVWQAGLTQPFTLPDALPPLRAVLVWDNLAGHTTPALVSWLCAHGVMPLYTPLGGSWLNMAESIQRIVVRRALVGHHPESTTQLKDWIAATVRGWNAAPTPFEWGGKRAARRQRARARRHALGGSGGWTRCPIARRSRTHSTATNGDNRVN
ncbi:MAG: transposase [Chloroflexota bacterium]